MDGRAFLDVARELVRGSTAAHWRSAVGRAYYALFLEGGELLLRWGFAATSKDREHFFVRTRLLYSADPDLRQAGRDLDWLAPLRNKADYVLSAVEFRNATEAKRAVDKAADALTRLDTVAADSNRTAAAIADIKARWP